jgi:hypothetical protein
MSGKPTDSGSGSGDGNEELSDWGAVKLKFGPEPGKVSFIYLYAISIVSSFQLFKGFQKPGRMRSFHFFANSI